jgi:hypothetical protein
MKSWTITVISVLVSLLLAACSSEVMTASEPTDQNPVGYVISPRLKEQTGSVHFSISFITFLNSALFKERRKVNERLFFNASL